MSLDHGAGARIAVGCCGFTRSRSEYYRHFRLVEIQESFYRLPRIQTVLRWREQAPAGFEFTMKVWQAVTHPPSSPTYRRSGLPIPPGQEKHYGFFRPSEEVRSAWERTAALARALACRVVLLQCPASFRECPEHVANLRNFCRDLDRGPFLLAWEPRGPWRAETVQGLCRELDLLHCIDPLVQTPPRGDPLYLRLHGGPGYGHKYNAEELSRLRALVEGRAGCVLFNNLDRFDDAQAFARLLQPEA